MPRQWGGTHYLICLNASVQHSTGNCLHVESLFHPMKHALSSVYWRWSPNLFQDLREKTQLGSILTNDQLTYKPSFFVNYAGVYIWLYDRNYKLINMELRDWWDANHLGNLILISRHLKTATLLREIENGWWLCYLPSKWHSHWSWHLQNLAGHAATQLLPWACADCLPTKHLPGMCKS